MVPLQSSAPALAPALAALVVLALFGAAVGALGSAVVRRLSNPVGKYRLLYAGVLFPFALLAYVVLAAVGIGQAILAPVSFPIEVAETVLVDFVTFLAAGSVWLAAYLPTVRGVRAVRDVSYPTRRALADMGRYVLGLCALLAVVVPVLQRAQTTGSPLVLAVVLAAFALAFLYASPWLLAALRSTTTPTGETADRLDRLRTRAGLDVRDVRVFDTDDEETATTLVRGPPGYRRLFVASTFLDRFDDETATALLAVEAGRLRAHVLEAAVGTVGVAGVALVASFSGWAPRWPALGVAVALLLAGFWDVRRRIRAADDYAAERVGPGTLADAFERYAEVHALEPPHRRFPNPLSIRVPLGDRIDRLRERAAADENV